MTHSRKTRSSSASNKQVKSGKMDTATFLRNVLHMKMTTHQFKFIRTIGSLIATQDAAVIISRRRTQSYGSLKMAGKVQEFNLVDGRDFLVPANQGKPVKIHKVK